MKNYIKFMDDLPLLVKVIFALPCLDILWGLYKIFVCYDKKNMPFFVLWIVLYLLPTGMILAIIDIVTLVLYNKVITLSDQAI